jgi:signal transduction histidine kinase
VILRLFNAQGIAGIAASLLLALLLGVQTIEKRHWSKRSARFEQLYRDEQAALAGTLANVRAAAATARAADQANAARVAADQRAINQGSSHDFETRLAAARAAAARLASGRLREQPQTAAAAGAGRDAPVPGLPAAAGRVAESAGQDRLPQPDRLIATEQAIQLDELIKWVRRQQAISWNGGTAAVDNGRAAVASPPSD